MSTHLTRHAKADAECHAWNVANNIGTTVVTSILRVDVEHPYARGRTASRATVIADAAGVYVTPFDGGMSKWMPLDSVAIESEKCHDEVFPGTRAYTEAMAQLSACQFRPGMSVRVDDRRLDDEPPNFIAGHIQSFPRVQRNSDLDTYYVEIEVSYAESCAPDYRPPEWVDIKYVQASAIQPQPTPAGEVLSIASWNRAHPIGTPVWVEMNGANVEGTTTSNAYGTNADGNSIDVQLHESGASSAPAGVYPLDRVAPRTNHFTSDWGPAIIGVSLHTEANAFQSQHPMMSSYSRGQYLDAQRSATSDMTRLRQRLATLLGTATDDPATVDELFDRLQLQYLTQRSALREALGAAEGSISRAERWRDALGGD